MKPENIKFLSAASELKLTGPDRSFVLAAAVASSVADFLSVPSMAVDSPSAEYTRQHALKAADMVGCFNEIVPFDLRCALEFVRKFWMTRYEVLHSRRTHDAVDYDYFCGYFNVSRNWSVEELACLNKFSIQINTIEVSARSILTAKEDAVTQANARAAAEAVEASGAVPTSSYNGMGRI